MLTTAADRIRKYNQDAEIYLFGQELNGESWAVCESEMLLRDQHGTIELGNSFSNDRFRPRKFDYMLANPPFGVEWKKVKDEVEDEAELGFAGRFGAGLPRINDGSFLFLQHMISKMNPVEDNGTRLAIVFNGSPLFTGCGWVGRVGDPPVDPGERLAGRHRRAPGPALLQHGHLDLLLDPVQPESRRAPRQGDPAGCPRPVGEDAQVTRRQAQGHQE